MEKINIAEILKDCPKGMELDCTMFDNVTFDGISNGRTIVAIRRTVNHKLYLDKYGCPLEHPKEDLKCVIFPKGKATWEGFVPPCKFKDGDVVISDLGDIHLLRTKDSSYCAYRWRNTKLDSTITTNITVVRLATEDERQKLFKAIKNNGYKWNSETKTLEKLIEPKFKVGDKVRHKDDKTVIIITGIKDDCYFIQFYNIRRHDYQNEKVLFKDQDQFELVRNEIKPKFKVGDIVQYITDSTDRRKIEEIDTLRNMYHTDSSSIMFEIEDDWKVVLNSENVKQRTDKVEPKFHEGDWVTDGISKCQIRFIDDTQYWYSENCILGSIESVDKLYHLWTIKDAKDGDVIFYDDGWTCIFKCIHGIWYSSYCFITNDGEFHTGYEEHAIDAKTNGNAHPATKEQCNLLFQKIKEAGYNWNFETKALEKIVKPRFKVGDEVKLKSEDEFGIITQVANCFYTINCKNCTHCWPIIKQDDWELIPNKFDINTLVPFESRVLVRNSDSGFWKPAFWGVYEAEKSNEHQYRNYLTTEGFVRQCIPYNDETKHLVGKTSDCPEYYKTWEKE